MSQPSDKILDDNFNEPENQGDPIRQKRLNRNGITLAILSFAFGTLLLLLAFSLPSKFDIIILGLYYLPIAFLINLIYFIFLLLASGTREEKRSFRKTAGLMCLNIPIAFFYFLKVVGS